MCAVECEGDGNAGVGSGGGVVAVSACMSGTRGPSVLSSTGDVAMNILCADFQNYARIAHGARPS